MEPARRLEPRDLPLTKPMLYEPSYSAVGTARQEYHTVEPLMRISVFPITQPIPTAAPATRNVFSRFRLPAFEPFSL
jgi:hypothetical protein